MSQNLFIDPQSAVVHLPQCSCLFVQVLEREDQDLWNNFKICGIISGSVVCLFRYWKEEDHDLWNNLRICREKSFDINASLLLCWIGQGAKHNIRDTKISVVRVGCQSMSYYDIVMVVFESNSQEAAPPNRSPLPLQIVGRNSLWFNQGGLQA